MTRSANQENIATAIGGFGALAMVSSLGYQIYLYLKHGVWLGLSVVEALHWIGAIGDNWYENPQDWIGVHKVLSFLNAGFSTFALCWFAALVIANDG